MPIPPIRQIHTKLAENWSCPLQVKGPKTSFTRSTTKRAPCRREGAMTCMGVGKRKQGGERTFFPQHAWKWRAKHFAPKIVVKCTGTKRPKTDKDPRIPRCRRLSKFCPSYQTNATKAKPLLREAVTRTKGRSEPSILSIQVHRNLLRSMASVRPAR